ncbi:MAG: hypothetical protein KDA80_06860 [Planctomycetaceae bacterium]|nr:hypothetical protein [Planctomycetaceae bacterium]
MTGNSLQATALVHEAYLRLVGDGESMAWRNRRHFFGAAAEAMRRILIDVVRCRKRIKRGGDVSTSLEVWAQRGIVSAAVNPLTIRDSVCDLLSPRPSRRQLGLSQAFEG